VSSVTQRIGSLPAVNWAAGRYEDVAAEVLPAAKVLVERAEIGAGERVVDLGCGTGNAALLAARAGARVTGVDPATRLLEIAAAAAKESGLEVQFVEGDAAAIPLGDAGADALISNFGVMFAPDQEAAAAEVSRVVAPDGRFAYSAWKPGTAIGKVATARGQALANAGQPLPERFAWHDPRAASELLARHGFLPDFSEHEISFTAPSPDEFAAREYAVHPMWAVARNSLGETELSELRERALEIFRASNEDQDGFRITSGYAVVVARRV
jgi:SAM-dependent methyltransferase